MPAQIFDKAREAMVQSQIYPSGVVQEPLLEAYRNIPREIFVPADKKSVSYLDDCLEFEKGVFLLEPMFHARMLEFAQLQPDAHVLDIGCASGYSSAILSRVVHKVTAIEERDNLVEASRKNLQNLNITNVQVLKSDLVQGYNSLAPYDTIIINGACQRIPENLLAQLKEEGVLVTVMKTSNSSTGKITKFVKMSSGQIASSVLCDANVGYCRGFEAQDKFVF
jgi:protein-L-isoaspartate(D-aspartate) O-methyltransferase